MSLTRLLSTLWGTLVKPVRPMHGSTGSTSPLGGGSVLLTFILLSILIHTHTPIFSTQSSLVVTHAYAVGTGVLVRRSAATSALGRSAAVRERRSLRGAAQRSSGDDHVGLSFQNQRSPHEPASTSSLPQHEVESSPRLERQAKSFLCMAEPFSFAGSCVPVPL